jgi:Dolichyl-phosphate-mannose-protein mannosyltransferase
MALIEINQNSAGMRRGRIDWRSPWTMFWIALLVRVLYITVARSYHFRVFADHFEFGWEMGRIARALATGRGYADPFVSNTGPTAWNPPLYPLILAGVFKLFGVYTPLSGWVILSINSLFSAATAPAIYEIARRCFSTERNRESIAQWSGWLWALYPAAMQYAVRWVWEMTLTTLLFAWVLVITLRICGIGGNARNTSKYWALFGLLWGGVALSNPSPLLFLPVCGIWILLSSKDKVAALKGAVLSAIIFVACLTPWAIRNWRAFHAFIPIRGNLGAELYAGNGPGSAGFPWGGTLPIVDGGPQIAVYRNMGEVDFVKMRGNMAKAYIRAHPVHFARISLKRVYFYWIGVPHPDQAHVVDESIRETNFAFLTLSGVLGLGLSWRRRIPAAGLFICAFLLLPISYYLVTPGARFRHPLEPLIAILSVYLFQSAEKSWRVRWFHPPATI